MSDTYELSIMGRIYVTPSFANCSEATRELVIERMLSTNPAEAMSSSVAVSNAPRLEVTSMEALASVPMALRLPQSKPTTEKEKQPIANAKHSTKEKQKKPVPM